MDALVKILTFKGLFRVLGMAPFSGAHNVLVLCRVNRPLYQVAATVIFTLGAQSDVEMRLALNSSEDPTEAKQRRGRAIWPWLVLLAVTLLAIYAYGQAVAAWEDTVRMWRDLVQLFWWIVPNGPSKS
jgi:hypothetical protein